MGVELGQKRTTANLGNIWLSLRRSLKVKIDPLDKLVSEYIRKKSGGQCERCGTYYGWQRLQCCHMFSRRYKSTRYDEDNLAALDFGCHQYIDSHPIEKIEFFKKRLGERGFDMLQARTRLSVKDMDLSAVALYLKQGIARIEKNGQ